MIAARRLSLAVLPTPLVPARRLGEHLGVEVWVKRDDLIGFAFGGTKTRAVDVVIGDAVARGHDELIGCGGPASNLCATLAAAAARADIPCTLVLFGSSPGPSHPNLSAMERWGARVIFTGVPDRASTEPCAGLIAAERASCGRHPFVVPRGAAIPLGVLSYASAADELDEQLTTAGIDPDCIVLPVGSGATIAGLLIGVSSWSRPTRLTGAVVSRPLADTAMTVETLATSAARCGRRPRPDLGRLELVDAIGPGFGVPTPDLRDAVALALRTEGIVVDITYGARALAVVGDLARRATGPIVLWHTGGWLDAVADLGLGRDHP